MGIHDFQQEFNIPFTANINKYQNKPTVNCTSSKDALVDQDFSQCRGLTQEDFKKCDEEDGYDLFLRKYNIDPTQNKKVAQQESFKVHPASNYSNLIEQKKLENNLSFSNNAVGPNEETASDDEVSNLEDLDLDYDSYAKREQQVSDSEYAYSYEKGELYPLCM